VAKVLLGRVTFSVGVSVLKPDDDIHLLLERAASTPPSATAATA